MLTSVRPKKDVFKRVFIVIEIL